MKFDYVSSAIVNFDEIDMGGGLYHANYLKYLDRSRIEYLRNRGLSFGDLIKSGRALVVAGLSCKYSSPIFCEEEILVCSKVVKVNTSSVVVAHQIFKAKEIEKKSTDPFSKEKPAFEAEVTLVYVDLVKKMPVKLDGKIKEILDR